MKFVVKFFSLHAVYTGTRKTTMEADAGMTVAALIDDLVQRYPALEKVKETTVVSINRKFVERDVVINEGDEVGLFPPVGGG